MTVLPDIAVGAIGAALIAGVVSLLGLVISKEQKVSEFRQAWIDALRSDVASLISHVNAIHGAIQAGFGDPGLNPKKLGGIANHKRERWKMPLPRYIEHLYKKQLSKDTPDDVRSIEIKVLEKRARKKAKNRTGVERCDDV